MFIEDYLVSNNCLSDNTRLNFKSKDYIGEVIHEILSNMS